MLKIVDIILLKTGAVFERFSRKFTNAFEVLRFPLGSPFPAH
jgi:hypothetical protein